MLDCSANPRRHGPVVRISGTPDVKTPPTKHSTSPHDDACAASPAQTIFTAMLLTAVNLRKIRAHRANIADNHTETIAGRARRRHTSLTEHLPDG